MSREKASKTKRKRKRRLNIKRAFLLALVLVLIAFCIKSIVKVDIGNIEVVGNEFLSDSQIIKLAGLTDDSRFFELSSKNVCDEIRTNPLIATCKLEHHLGFDITIAITENKPVFFYAYTGKLVLSNASEIDENNIYGVPTLINYVPEKVLKAFSSGLAGIKSDIIRSISEIEYSPSENSDGAYIDEERFMLSMNDGNIVYVNNRKLDVLNNYDKIYASLGDRKGYYNFDSDFNNYLFKDFENGEILDEEKKDEKQEE